jgi:pimeloyl-ACP methyl ester carboxylesterase
MFYNAKNKSIDTGKYLIDYSTFGYGDNIIVILPGIYGFTSITAKAIALAFQFKQMAKDFSIFFFNRRKILPDQFSISEMADDQNEIMDKLGIKSANIFGFSLGGMIAQDLAINYPKKVKSLVLGVTTSRPNEVLKNVLNGWIKLAQEDNYSKLLIDVMERTYSERYLKKIRKYYPLMTRIGKPGSFKHFINEANASFYHNTYERLHQIKCQTLIIGGGNDNIVGKDSFVELAENIENQELLLYKDYGHGAILEEKNCIKEITDFFKKNNS